MIDVADNRQLAVTFERRCHNPILREAALDRDGRRIPWLNGHRIVFGYPMTAPENLFRL